MQNVSINSLYEKQLGLLTALSGHKKHVKYFYQRV